jgi:hypothetical protein
MAIAVSEAAATAIAAAIEKQTAVMVTQNALFNTFLTANFSPAGALVPNTPVAISRVTANGINDMTVIMTTMLDQQQKTVAALEVLQNALAGISSQIASGVTTAQVAASDQIKMNKFKKQTANEALERAGLPPTEVKEPAFKEATKEAVEDTLIFKSQIGISTLIERQISDALSWIGLTMTDLIANSIVGDTAKSVIGKIKVFLGIKEPIVLTIKTGAAAKADARGVLLADPVPIGSTATGTWT